MATSRRDTRGLDHALKQAGLGTPKPATHTPVEVALALASHVEKFVAPNPDYSPRFAIALFGKNAGKVAIGYRTWFWSYQTCVAFQDNSPHRPIQIRRETTPSVTSSRHMQLMGVVGWPRESPHDFNRIAHLTS